MRRSDFKYPLLACIIVIFAASLAWGAEGFTFITKDQLKQEISKPGVTVIDVRTDRDWNSSRWKIQGAQRQDPAEANGWMDEYPKDKTIVLYCA